MKIRMRRYYGDGAVTKSQVWIEGTDFRCEAREPAFRDYSESFPGASKFCLPRGEFACKPMATEISPMTLTVMKAPAHRSCRFIYDPLHQTRANAVVLGEADEAVPAPEREVSRSKETFERLQRHVYRAYAQQETVWLAIENQMEENQTSDEADEDRKNGEEMTE